MTLLILIVGAIILSIFFLKNLLTKNFIKKAFSNGGIQVAGKKGKGKDVLFSWVINSRRKPYISNIRYTKNEMLYTPLKAKETFSLGGNEFYNFIDNTIIPYEYKEEDGKDIYISDGGVYFPSTYDNELNKEYPSAALFVALSRHIGKCNVHVNVQDHERLWKKLREQMDGFITCRSCLFIKWLNVFRIRMTYYDRRQTAEEDRRPMKRGFFSSRRAVADGKVTDYGQIKNLVLWGRLKYNYDTRRFKKILKQGDTEYVKEESQEK